MELAMVDKLIRGKLIEIVIVIILVLLTVPVWLNFSEKMSSADIMSLDDYNLKFEVSSTTNNSDYITISNDYYINKSYKLLMKVSENINIEESQIMINGTLYDMDNFFMYEMSGYYYYTLAANYLSGASDIYEIEPKIAGESVYYTYVFEESNNF